MSNTKLNKLRMHKNRLIKGDSKFNLGDIVKDIRSDEICIVIGPADYSGDEFDNVKGFELTSNPTILLLSLREDDIRRTRVRYIRKNYLKLVEKSEKSLNFDTDPISTFCSSQCILDCDSDCSLWKYKKKND